MRRAARGRLLPIELSDERVDFGYVGLDGVTRITTVAAEGATVDPIDDPATWPGASVLVTWRARLDPNARLTVGWTVTTTRRPARRGRTRRVDAGRRASAGSRRGPSADAEGRGWGSRPHRRPHRCRRHPRIVCWTRRGSRRTTSSSIGRSGARSSTWPCSGTTGRPRARRISPPGSRGSRRCSGATASSPHSSWSRSTRPSRSRR